LCLASAKEAVWYSCVSSSTAITATSSKKSIFKGAAITAASKAGLFQKFYAALVAKGMMPKMARLTLVRKIPAITLIVRNKGVRFDAQHLKPQTA